MDKTAINEAPANEVTIKRVFFLNTPVKLKGLSANFYQSVQSIVLVPIKDKEQLLAPDLIPRFAHVHYYESAEHLINIIKSYHPNSASDRIFCISEDNLLIAAHIRKLFSIPGLKPAQALLFRNKVAMKQHLAKHNIATPTFGTYKKGMTFDDIIQKVSCPFILKPTDALGAQGVYIIQTKKDFDDIENLIQRTAYQYETYISGTLYHIDSLYQQGLCLFSVVCAYASPNLDFQKGYPALSIILLDDDKISHKLKDFSHKTLQAMDYQTGPTHMEVFIQNDTPIFLEVASRTPGGIIVHLHNAQFNLNMIDVSFQLETHQTLEEPLFMRKDSFIAGGLIPKKEGTVSEIKSLNLASLQALTLFIKKGQTMGPCESLRDIAGTVILEHRDYKILEEDFNFMRDFSPFIVRNVV